MKKIKVSIIFNILISILVLFSTIIMFTGFKFMHGPEAVLVKTKLEVFKFFTVDSNIFMGIISLLFFVYEIKLLKGKIKEIPNKLYILKLMSTVSVTLTFVVVFVYFVPIMNFKVLPLIMNSNLFFHLVVPLFSIITFIFFENTIKISSRNTLMVLIPPFIYGIYYLSNILVHIENHKVSTDYDFYYFVQSGIWTSIIVIPVLFLITYIIGLGLWKLNRKFC